MKPATTSSSATASTARSYVTLGVGDDVFAVDVGYVREILDHQPISNLPHAPSFLVGMIDVRGRAVPVVDLRRRLGLGPAETTGNQRILVLEITIGGRALMLALLCDRVFDVAEFSPAGLESAPELGVPWKSEYIKAIGRWRGAFIIIFDMEKLFSTEDIVRLGGGRADGFRGE